MRPGVAADDTRKERFLEALREQGNITQAAKSVGVTRQTAYNWQKQSEEFAAKMAEATEEAADRLEQEAWRRAVSGTEKPVYQGGKLVGKIREYSDTLLIFLLKGNRPDKFRETRQQIELTGANGGPVEVATLTPAERQARIDELISKRGS